MRLTRESLLALIALEDRLPEFTAFVRDTIRTTLRGRSLPSSKAELHKKLEKDGDKIGPLGWQMLDLWDALEAVESVPEGTDAHEASVRGFVLGVLLRDFLQISRGRAKGKMYEPARKIYLRLLRDDSSRAPSAKVMAEALEKLGYKTTKSFPGTYSRWRKGWDREI